MNVRACRQGHWQMKWRYLNEQLAEVELQLRPGKKRWMPLHSGITSQRERNNQLHND
jgi:hypothetical protein